MAATTVPAPTRCAGRGGSARLRHRRESRPPRLCQPGNIALRVFSSVHARIRRLTHVRQRARYRRLDLASDPVRYGQTACLPTGNDPVTRREPCGHGESIASTPAAPGATTTRPASRERPWRHGAYLDRQEGQASAYARRLARCDNPTHLSSGRLMPGLSYGRFSRRGSSQPAALPYRAAPGRAHARSAGPRGFTARGRGGGRRGTMTREGFRRSAARRTTARRRSGRRCRPARRGARSRGCDVAAPKRRSRPRRCRRARRRRARRGRRPASAP
jgi:hypothetical protein